MNEEIARPWILTFTGQQFFYDEPEGYRFTIEEIAHALSHCGRFAGHLRKFYSVAQHSCLVAEVVRLSAARVSAPPAEAMTLCRVALLHDASEAFLVDLPRPLKHMASLAGYRVIEERIERAIYASFGLLEAWRSPDVARLIKLADATMLAVEKRDLRPVQSRWEDAEEQNRIASSVFPSCFKLEPLESSVARARFVDMWKGGAA